MTYAKAISVAEVFHNKPRPVEVPDEQQMTIWTNGVELACSRWRRGPLRTSKP